MAQHLEKCVVYQSRGIAEEKKRLDELDEREALELESTLLEAPLDDADTGETGDGETAGARDSPKHLQNDGDPVSTKLLKVLWLSRCQHCLSFSFPSVSLCN